MNWDNDNLDLTPEDYIRRMFEYTDLDGVLYMPNWGTNGYGWENNAPNLGSEADSLRCRLQWNFCDMENAIARYQKLRADIQQICPHHKSIYMTLPQISQTLTDPHLLEVWKTYMAPSNVGDFDFRLLDDIVDRYDMQQMVKQFAESLAKGQSLEPIEREMLIEHMDIKVTEEEKSYYARFAEAVHKDAEKRVGEGLCAYRVIFHARRLSVLLYLKAPKVMVRNEERELARAMVLHQFCSAMETVSTNLRLQMERLELMSDEELDALASPKKMNSRKSMAPLFVYLLIRDRSNAENHLKQQQILRMLEEYPYEIFVDRKTLSRIVHNLVDSALCVHADTTGIWYE